MRYRISYSFLSDKLLHEEAENVVYLVVEEGFLEKCIKGLPNPRCNRWANAVGVATRNTLGASILLEDHIMGLCQSDEALLTCLKPLFKQTSLIGTADELSSSQME